MTVRQTLVCLTAAVLFVAGAVPAQAAQPSYRNDFNGSTLRAPWRSVDWGCKDVGNVYQRRGQLVLRAAASSNPECPGIEGGRIDSFDSPRRFGDGVFSARVKQDPAIGSWQSIWITGSDGEHPANGEIDVAETLGRQEPPRLNMLIHSDYLDHRRYADGRLKRCSIVKPLEMDMSAWHTYDVLVTSEVIMIFVDRVRRLEVSREKAASLGCSWPHGGDKRMIIDNGVSSGKSYAGPVDRRQFPTYVRVDYVAWRYQAR